MRRALLALLLLAGGCYNVDALGADFDGGTDGTHAPDGSLGTNWHALPSGTTTALRSVWAAGAGDLWVVGASSTVLHVTHGAVAIDPMAPGYPLRAVFGPTTPKAGGDSGALLQRRSDGWHDTSLGDASYFALWGAADDDFWAAGSGGTLLHRTASGSASVPSDVSGVTGALFGLFGRGNEVWAAGEAGALVHLVGETPTLLASGTTADLHAVFADESQILVVGDGGVVLRSTDGVTFVTEASGTSVRLLAVFGAGGTAWAAGEDGTILVRSASGWTLERSGGSALRALSGTGPTDLWAAGDDGTLLYRAP